MADKSKKKLNKPLLAGNWKLNPISLNQAAKLSKQIITKASKIRELDFALCPPHLWLASLKTNYHGRKIKFGAQNMYPEARGAHTGEVSPVQLNQLGIEYVILGHSERRRSLEQGGSGETDQIVNTKLKSALKHGITPIVCIGEPKREVDGSHLRFIRNQIKNSLSGLPSSQLALVVIAYEPIWAIGGRANTAITGHELHQVSLYIRKVLAELWRPAIADEVRILYGGSVKPQNAFDLAKNGNMDGFLVGGASLEADSFIGIANEMKRAAKNG